MFNWIIRKLIGSKNQRTIKKLLPVVAEINAIEAKLQNEPEEALRERTAAWKEQFKAFHSPAFLAGVNLRIADDEALNACLENVAGYFDRLSVHFPEVKGADLVAAAKGTASADEKREIITKAHEQWLELKPKFIDIEKQMLNDILPEMYAVVKNAARRLCGREVIVTDHPLMWNMVHFDVQLIGGIALHRGMIAEMATGEGKTLVATLPVALNALTGRGVHLITVNDYLARRDSDWMGHLYKLIGLTVGCIQNDQPPHFRRDQYLCDITYGTNSEFGFDYLRDNGMASSKDQQVQRGHYFAVVDEVDSVLIDEARTPLIISGPVTVSTHQFDRYKPLVEQLVRRQNTLCAKLVSDARALFEKGETEAAGRMLYQTYLAQPKNRALMRCMEEPELRKLKEKAELSYALNDQKVELFKLKEELYYAVDEKTHEADLTEKGREFLNPDDPDAFVLPDLATAFTEIDLDGSLSDAAKQQKKVEVQEKLDNQGQRIHNISQLLRAYCLYEKGVQYLVMENKVVIIDENTGREMPGRRWSDGLHGAVEAKEGVQIDAETQTLATITIQNYFRLYQKLGGMTGTAETDAAEFHDIYSLDVLPIPTNRSVLRIDHNDSIFKTRREKYNAAIAFIKEAHAKGQPILVGTASVEASETVSRMLKLQKIPHAVLNAKYHRQEAEIVANAGQKGAVMIATNMAGRGTDIKLAPGVAELGGLLVVATERHLSRRVDRQLRGRCARQGDPGASKFFISFEDELMMKFGAAERMTSIMERFGMEEGEELQHPWLNKSVETAQKRVEQQHYVWRKRVLEYDDVMNQQREVVYDYRNEILESSDTRVLIDEALQKGVTERVADFIPPEGRSDTPIDYEGLTNWVNTTFPVGISQRDAAFETKTFQEVVQFIIERVQRAYGLKIADASPRSIQELERAILLNAVDRLWQEHLYALDALKEGVNLRTYGQKDPLIEFKSEAYVIFAELMRNINGEVLNNLFRGMAHLQALELFLQAQAQQRHLQESGGEEPGTSSEREEPTPEAPVQPKGPRIMLPTIKKEQPKVGRNDPCPCGSGKKYKACCGRIA